MTTESQPSSTPQAGVSIDEYNRAVEAAQRAAAEAQQWRELAVNAQPQTYQQPAPQRAFSYQQDGTPQMPDATLQYENPAEYGRQLQAYINWSNQQAVQQAAGSIAPQLAQQGKWMSQNDSEYKDVWAKYGGEIEQEMVRNNVPPQMRTKEAWDLLANVVRGRHYRELADELANQRLQGGGFGTESGSNVGSAPTASSDALTTFWNSGSQWVEKAKAQGMTVASLKAHIIKQGISEQQWVDDMNKGRSFSAEAA